MHEGGEGYSKREREWRSKDGGIEGLDKVRKEERDEKKR